MNDNNPASLYYTMFFETKVIRVIEDTLIPANIKIHADVCSDTDLHSVEMMKAMLKIKAWVESVLSNSVLLSIDNTEGSKMFFDEKGVPRSGNNVVLTPAVPTDDMLAVLLQAKFDALSGSPETFLSCEISSDNILNLRSTFVGLGSELLPPIEDWIGPRSYFDQPWWHRDDISTYDVIPDDDADLNDKPTFAQTIIVTGLDGEKVDVKPNKPSFKPKVITGGKQDEPKE